MNKSDFKWWYNKDSE